MVSNFILQPLLGEPLSIYGDRTQTRSCCYVDDALEGNYRVFRCDRVEPTKDPDEVTIRELAEAVFEVSRVESDIPVHERSCLRWWVTRWH